MKFSEAIRLGAMLKPQAFGRLEGVRLGWRGWFPVLERTTCALGAAFESASVGTKPYVPSSDYEGWRGTVIKAGKTIHVVDIPQSWETVYHTYEWCPICCHHELRKPVSLLIPHLNDDHHWTREQIADWVESIERAQDIQTSPVETAATV